MKGRGKDSGMATVEIDGLRRIVATNFLGRNWHTPNEVVVIAFVKDSLIFSYCRGAA